MRKLIPYILNLIPRRYLIRLSFVFLKIAYPFFKGKKYFCPVCESSLRKMLPYGHTEKVYRKNALCPKCLSLERHRLLWLFLHEKTSFFCKKNKVLHIAPEQCFYTRFRKLSNLDYTTADLESPIADIKLDIQNIPLENDSYDIVICNHVLEHVKSDRQALREIYRILRPGGYAILQSCIEFSLDNTYEDISITDPQEREKHFNQRDHYRLYGKDYNNRILEAGFEIRDENFLDEVKKEQVDRFRLPNKDYLFAYWKS